MTLRSSFGSVGHEHDLQLLLQARALRRQAVDLLAGHGPHLLVGVVAHGARLLELRLDLTPLPRARDDRLKARHLPTEVGELRWVGRDLGSGELPADLLVARLELGEPVDHAFAAAAASRSEARHDSSEAMLTSSMERSGGRVVSDWSQSPGA